MANRGRPKINNNEILDQILSDKEAYSLLTGRLKEIGAILSQIEMYSESLKDAIESVSEDCGLTKGFISKLARLQTKGKLLDHITEAEQFRALMEVSGE